MENYYNIPKVFVLVFPYPVKKANIIIDIISHYTNINGVINERKINLINIWDDIEVKGTYSIYNCDNPSGFSSIFSSLNDCDNIIVNLSERFYNDLNFYRYLDEIKTIYSLNYISFLVLPSILSSNGIENFVDIVDNINSIIVSSAEENVVYGNIISICSQIKKNIVFFMGSQGVWSPKSNFI